MLDVSTMKIFVSYKTEVKRERLAFIQQGDNDKLAGISWDDVTAHE